MASGQPSCLTKLDLWLSAPTQMQAWLFPDWYHMAMMITSYTAQSYLSSSIVQEKFVEYKNN
jgi:hypothetical protein